MKQRLIDVAIGIAWFLGGCILIGILFDNDFLSAKELIIFTILGIMSGLIGAPVRRKFKEMVMPQKKD